jgi:hypothetical protein
MGQKLNKFKRLRMSQILLGVFSPPGAGKYQDMNGIGLSGGF